jgi:hypothetical protein
MEVLLVRGGSDHHRRGGGSLRHPATGRDYWRLRDLILEALGEQPAEGGSDG